MLKRRPFRLLLFLLFSCFATSKISAQQIKINAKNKPLNKVLIEMGRTYNVQFSFNDQLLSKCFISDNDTYDTPEQAITKLIKNCQLTFKLNEGVFVIYALNRSKKLVRQNILKGSVTDAINGEALPYSNIQINTTSLTTDRNGYFSFKSQDSTFNTTVSYVGYYIKDTLVSNGSFLNIKLTPTVVNLEEIIIHSNRNTQIASLGHQPGLIKINSKVAQFLPGNKSNTIFNTLRLQPGILAAGEQTNDYLIWGSYKGQTQTIFDGITLFNIGSTNDNIGAINPFITKDIEVYKGGYNAQLGDRTGSIVNITGTAGKYEEFGTQVSIDNKLTNLSTNIPLGRKNVLQLMLRKSYFDLINLSSNKTYDNSYTIDQKFTDSNIKLSGFRNNGDEYYISLLGNKDDVAYNITDKQDKTLSRYRKKDQQQIGGSMYYGKRWKSSGHTNFSLAHSNLNIKSTDSRQYDTSESISKLLSVNSVVSNGVSETSLKINHHLPSFRKQSWLFGTELVNNKVYLDNEDKLVKTNTSRINGFIKNNISVSQYFSIQPGIRLDIPLNIKKTYIQPRISAIIKPFKFWKINLATGIYNQFIVESPIFDNTGNTYNTWSLSDEKLIPVVKGIHYVSGISYSKNDITISAEGFYKTNTNLSRFISNDNSFDLSLAYGESRSLGLDLFIKKKINKHQFWISYTLSKTEELFTNFKIQDFQLAPHDQRHELKGAGLFNLDPIHLSFNYVYGSGILNREQLSSSKKIIPYNRFDIALLYRFNLKKYKLETGLSILNVFDRFNVRYNRFSSFQNSETVYQQALPFSPIIMLNFSF